MTDKFKEKQDWESRNGGKALIVKVYPDGRLLVHNADGRFLASKEKTYDLIRPWEEPEYRYVNFDEDGCTSGFDTRKEADKYAACDRISCQKIKVERGRYDD